jgi:hypothetical protein
MIIKLIYKLIVSAVKVNAYRLLDCNIIFRTLFLYNEAIRLIHMGNNPT